MIPFVRPSIRHSVPSSWLATQTLLASAAIAIGFFPTVMLAATRSVLGSMRTSSPSVDGPPPPPRTAK